MFHRFLILRSPIGDFSPNIASNASLRLLDFNISLKSPPKFFSKTKVVFNTESVTSLGPGVSRKDVRKIEKESGRSGEGVGYNEIEDDNTIS